jgi:hypothetical protein
LDDLESKQAATSTPSTPAKKQKLSKQKQSILSEVDLRRSVRLKKVHRGFKSTACKDKNCVGCSTTPPAISPSITKDLGASFCDINPDDLTEENLSKQPKGKATNKKVIKRKASGPSSSKGVGPSSTKGNAPQ